MPKVSEEYFAEKRKFIADAAFRVCGRKSLSAITMQDIIDESGLSQGGIYRFFRDIDEIIAEMILNMRRVVDFRPELNRIVSGEHKTPAEKAEVIRKVFRFIAKIFKGVQAPYMRLGLEMNMFLLSYPERAHKVFRLCGDSGSYAYLGRITGKFFAEGVADGSITPRIPPSDILAFIMCAYDGILMDCMIAEKIPEKNEVTERINTDALTETLCRSALYLLGLEN